MTSAKWKRTREFVATEVDGMHVLLSIRNGKYVALNATANRIWQLLEEPSDESTIVAALVRDYVVEPERCKASVARTLAELSSLGLVGPVPS